MTNRNVEQVEDAWLSGETDFDRFIRQFEMDFMKPVELRFQKMMWQRLTPADKDFLKAMDPEAYENVSKVMEA